MGGRESPACRGDGYPLCGDTLSFAPALKYAPYYNTTMARYSDESAWVVYTTTRLRSWGFNSIGGWSAKIMETKSGLYYAHLLDMLTTWQDHQTLPDIFGSAFYQRCLEIAKSQCAPRENDEMLLGYQTDNEIPWYTDFLAQYLTNLGNSTFEGNQHVIEFLQQKYHGNISELNKAWNINAKSFPDVTNHLKDTGINRQVYNQDRDDFLFVVATEYFHVTTTAIKGSDPNHLILGCRADTLPDPVIKALVPYVDVVDVHSYTTNAPLERLAHTYALSKKPIILGEFSFTAVDSNLPNTRGARSGIANTTQSDRARAYRNYVEPLLKVPYVIGYHWWQWADEPSTGRWPDGENSNYGLVHIDDDVYAALTSEMTTVNRNAEAWHSGGTEK